MTNNYKQLCAELVHIADALDSGTELASNQGQAMDGYSALAAFRDVAYRARAALTEDPTDEELLCVAAESINGYNTFGIKPGEYEKATEQAVEAYGSELCDFARAVLARWGNHPGSPDSSLQPITPPPEPEGQSALDDVHYEWELEDYEGEWQAGGSANSLEDAQRDGMRYLQIYTQDGFHRLIIRRHCTKIIQEINND